MSLAQNWSNVLDQSFVIWIIQKLELYASANLLSYSSHAYLSRLIKFPQGLKNNFTNFADLSTTSQDSQ